MRSERKFVTVMFADIKGSLQLIAGQDPEHVDEILASVVDTMRQAVQRFGGTISQILGDGLMALFGAPRATEDHAARACLAALAMRAAIRNQALARVEVRIGLNSGEVVVRAMLDDATAHYGAVGEAVHIAARMEQAAAPDQILLTGETRRLTQDMFQLNLIGPLPVKGLEQPVEAFELVTMLPRGRAPKRTATRPSPFVGRDGDLAVLHLARDEAAIGRGRVVRVLGEAGCGKSRLLREFLTSLPASDWLVWHAEALPHRQTSYATVISLLTGLFGFTFDDPLDTRREKVETCLAELVGARADGFTQPLSSLLDLGVDDPAWHGLEPWERREQTLTVICEVFRRASRGHHAAAVIIEDGHWLDPESASLFERLAALSAGERLLKIVTERAEQQLRWTEASAWTICNLRSLDEASARRLLRAHLVPGPGIAALEERLIEHTQGNPLFIEECLYALAETGELTRSSGDRFQLARPVASIRVPRSLRGLLESRVDSLPDGDKDILQAAAVVGTAIPVSLLRHVAAAPEEILQPAIRRLCRDGFLLPDPVDPARLLFRHGLTREAVYGSILKRTRTRMHASAFATLEGRPGATTDAVDLLADHAFRAELWPKAAAYARQAGAKAATRDANAEAWRVYEQALIAANHCPPGSERDQMLLNLHLEARTPIFRLGDVAALRAHIDQAITLAEQQDDYRRLGNCHVFRSHALWLNGDAGGALAAAERVAEIAATHADQDLHVRSRFQQGLVHLTQSRTAETMRAMRDVLDHISTGNPGGRYGLDDALAVTALAYLVRAAADAGDFTAAETALAETRVQAQRLGRRFSSIFADTAEGYLLLARGRPAPAIAPLERAVDLCRAADARLIGPVPASFLALAYVDTGDSERSLSLARQAVEDAARMGFLAAQPMRLAILARALRAGGADQEAMLHAQEALASARRLGEPGAEAHAMLEIAELHLRQGRIGHGHDAFNAALAQAAALGLRPLAASCERRLGAAAG